MTDSIVLICAILASLAGGVLFAYGVCLGMFRIFQMHAEQAAAEIESQIPATAQVAEG